MAVSVIVHSAFDPDLLHFPANMIYNKNGRWMFRRRKETLFVMSKSCIRPVSYILLY